MDKVRAHAHVIQDEGKRKAKNSEMLLHCLVNSITKNVSKSSFRSEDIPLGRNLRMDPTKMGVAFLKY